MLLQDIREARRLERARRQPSLYFLPFPVADVLAAIQADLFPDVRQPVGISFVHHGPLACVCEGTGRADIYVHQLLNHAETPAEVASLICKHELLHLRIKPRERDGRLVQHPPEFWAAERAICPERAAAWAWIWTNLGDCLARRPRRERIDVRPGWKEVWGRPKIGLAACQGAGRPGLPMPALEELIW